MASGCFSYSGLAFHCKYQTQYLLTHSKLSGFGFGLRQNLQAIDYRFIGSISNYLAMALNSVSGKIPQSDKRLSPSSQKYQLSSLPSALILFTYSRLIYLGSWDEPKFIVCIIRTDHTIIMNFFNKYKDLFGVSDNTPIPKSKLTINNNLFIDKPFVPTYQETLSINSKLRDLRKDYTELESQIESINMAIKSPNRATPRKGKQTLDRKEKETSHKMSPIQTNKDIQKNRPFLKLDKKSSMEAILRPTQSIVMDSSQEMKNPFGKKRMTWLKDEQVNLAKHSQMNYIFNHKIKQENLRAKNVGEMAMPKAENFLFSPATTTNQGPKIKVSQNYQPANRPRIIASTTLSTGVEQSSKRRDPSNKQLDYEGALRRREEAKRNLKSRRQKLGYIYRTSW